MTEKVEVQRDVPLEVHIDDCQAEVAVAASDMGSAVRAVARRKLQAPLIGEVISIAGAEGAIVIQAG